MVASGNPSLRNMTMKATATILGLALTGPALADVPQQCDAWLADHYQEHELTETIRDYERDGARHFRANYRVLTSMNEVATIGFDCTVYPNGQVRPIPETTPYAAEKQPEENSLPQTRLKYGADGCPDMSQWRRWMDEIRKTDDWVNLSDTCVWIAEGQLVLGPIEDTEYRGASFVLIELPGGNRYWIEPSNL